MMGVVFRKYGITFAEIISSPMYRTVETAEMAAGTPTAITMANERMTISRSSAFMGQLRSAGLVTKIRGESF